MKPDKPIYRSISDMEKVFRTSIRNCFSEITPPSVKGPIILRRFPIKELTPRATSYISIIKKMQDLFDVRVFRNNSSIEEGLYVVGRQYLVDSYLKVLRSLIRVVETNDQIYHTLRYADKLIKDYLYLIFDLVEYKESIITEEVKDDCLRDEILTDQFAKETPQLSSKKRFYEKLSFIPK